METVTKMLESGSSEVLNELKRAVFKIHGAHDPDLEQEAYLRSLKAFRRAGTIVHPRALLWKIVRDTVADHWRIQSRHRWEDLDQVQERVLAIGTDAERALDRIRRAEQLRDAILRLGCDIRGAVYLFYLEDYSVPSIARIYGKTPSAVKMALHRGRRQLQRMLGTPATN